jgi:hypothetical protein
LGIARQTPSAAPLPLFHVSPNRQQCGSRSSFTA